MNKSHEHEEMKEYDEKVRGQKEHYKKLENKKGSMEEINLEVFPKKKKKSKKSMDNIVIEINLSERQTQRIF